MSIVLKVENVKFRNILKGETILFSGVEKDKRHRLKILTDSEEIELWVDEEHTIYEQLLRNGIAVENLCGGKGICGKCSIRTLYGSFSRPSEHEGRWIKILGRDARLSCQVKALSDCVIKIDRPQEESEGKILSWGLRKAIKPKPRVTVREIKISPIAAYGGKGCLETFLEVSDSKNYDPQIIPLISRIFRDGKTVIGVISYNGEIIDIVHDKSQCELFGAAVDIGTTTVVVSVCDLKTGRVVGLESAYNQQIRFGEDVISRVDYARRDKKNIDELKSATINTINELISRIVDKNNLDSHSIYEVVCSGNTTMLSFLLGDDFYYSSRAPFIPPFSSSLKVKARDLGIKINPRGYVRTAPSISAYVGSDVVADILASGLSEFGGVAVLIDIGTNGEIVLKTRTGEFLATSCAAGPALEGYGLRHGMRAVKGAIESVVIDEYGTSYYKVIGDARPIGICGSGVVEAIAWMWLRNIIDDAGRIVKKSDKLISMSLDQPQYILVPAEQSAHSHEITITQTDIRKVQLAKAAIFAALMTLLRVAKTSIEEIERIYVAGAFGNYLDIFAAQVLGMLPDIARDKFTFVGNGSLIGAEMILLSSDSEDKVKEIVRSTKVIELNLIKDFQKEFIQATHIPHQDKKLFRNVISKATPFKQYS